MTENFTCDEFCGGRLKLFQSCRGPRVNLDTILLTSWVSVKNADSKFLEAGCASGAVALMLAMKFDKLKITGLEIQPELVKLAKLNSQNNNLNERVNFVEGDLRDKNIFPSGLFDGLVINPPYSPLNSSSKSDNISRSTARLELTCTPDDVSEFAHRVLKSKGRMFAVFKSERLDIFLASMLARKITPKRIKPVYPKINCNSGIFLIECIKDGGQNLTLLPPLIVRDENNNYTDELLRAYEI